MNCEQFQREAFDLPTKESKEHEASCSACSQLLEQIQGEGQLLSSTKTPQPPADLWQKIQSQIEKKATVPRLQIVSWVGIAAALLLGVMGYLVRPSPPPIEKEKTLHLNIVEVSPEKARSLVGFVPGYDQEDSQQALANAMVPFPYRRDR